MPKNSIKKTKELMAALGRMPPKQHKDMKLGKNKEKSVESPKKKGNGIGARTGDDQ